MPVGGELGLLLHRHREELVGASLQRQCLVTLALGMFKQGHKGLGHRTGCRFNVG
jgi:hypothetical protein